MKLKPNNVVLEGPHASTLDIVEYFIGERKNKEKLKYEEENEVRGIRMSLLTLAACDDLGLV